jgi:hypothetical protein
MRLIVAVCIAVALLSCGREETAVSRRPVDQRRGPDSASKLRGQVEPSAHPPLARRAPRMSNGQTLYVPVYSHVYWGEQPTPLNLACTLSIRNVDPTRPIRVASVDYYDTLGMLVGHYLDQAVTLAPLETTEYYVAERDVAGGSGANFLVTWTAASPVNAPIVEAVMIGIYSGQGISFVSQAREIAE